MSAADLADYAAAGDSVFRDDDDRRTVKVTVWGSSGDAILVAGRHRAVDRGRVGWQAGPPPGALRGCRALGHGRSGCRH